MSRRRATDETTVHVDPAPPLSTDPVHAKRHTPIERIGRFFRNRPVSSLLLICALFSLALFTYSVGRMIGQTVSHALYGTDNTTTSSTADLNSTVHHADEQSHLAAQHNSQNASDSYHSAAQSQDCIRKFEPGRLGSDKTLCVTDEYYFDISIGNTPVGRFKIGVFGHVVPKSAANFRALVTCTGVFSDQSLCYRHDTFHRIVTDFVIQGGSKATGRSIYSGTFREEKEKDHHSFLSHNEKGVVAWAEYPIGSQFYVLIRDDAKYLDKNHVVFGVITEGMDVLEKIHSAPRSGEEPKNPVKITACGDAHKHT